MRVFRHQNSTQNHWRRNLHPWRSSKFYWTRKAMSNLVCSWFGQRIDLETPRSHFYLVWFYTLLIPNIQNFDSNIHHHTSVIRIINFTSVCKETLPELFFSLSLALIGLHVKLICVICFFPLYSRADPWLIWDYALFGARLSLLSVFQQYQLCCCSGRG